MHAVHDGAADALATDSVLLRSALAAGATLFGCPVQGCGVTARTRANVVVHLARSHAAQGAPAWLGADGTPACPCGARSASSTAFYYHAMTCASSPRAAETDALLRRVAQAPAPAPAPARPATQAAAPQEQPHGSH